ncbi:hypothetical protein OQI89_08425 [Lentilactobacillus diolivorans]|uniref:hypothetical protein n=1 Tax=Lentilactobacillus diolivorans TaxID=179838 RepID=UPI0024692B55|nr:hypothetical protein [Lentilactobacillus diolivorans]MDH5105873.1 hypothetical protein [Lentilactobacillus diolivorans]
MKMDLKKSLFVSATALGLFTAIGAVNSTTANAKTRVRVTSNRAMTSDASSRNVNFTGSSALYNKAGTLKGARKVASTSRLSRLAGTQSSTDNVRAYRVARTNRGSIYYKVVTFNGNYRGWIYGGKSTADFGGGVRQYDTFQTGALSDAQKNGTFTIANPGTTNDGKTVTYKQPAWTQYKVGRQITDSSPLKGATFKIDQVGTRTRENDQWVHITATDTSKSAANGWILFSGLTSATNSGSGSTTTDTVADNAIKINVVDSSNSQPITSITYTKNGVKKDDTLGLLTNGVWTLQTADQNALQTQLAAALKTAAPNSYYPSTLNAAQIQTLAQGKFGSTITLVVTKGTAPIADKAVRVYLVDPNGNNIKYIDYTNTSAVNGNTLGTANGSTWTLAAGDVTALQDQINKALVGTGYALANGTLTAADQSTLAQATFGGTAKISTVASNVPQSGYSAVTPYTSDGSALTATSGPAVNLTLTGHNGKYSANDVYKWANSWNPLDKLSLNQTVADDKEAATANEQFENAAKSQYIPANNMQIGPGNGALSSDAILNAVKTNGATTLNSPVYPVLTHKNIIGSVGYVTVTWKHLPYTATKADATTYGQPAKVYYSAGTAVDD